MHGYRAFGLNVGSELELPSWPAGAPPWDVEIVRGEIPRGEEGGRTLWEGLFSGKPGCGLFSYPQLGRILVERGARITVEFEEAVDPRRVEPAMGATVFAALLYQRDELCLHASAVAWEGRAYLFMGPSGAGKSTTASALLARGAELMSDDVTVVRPGAGGAFLAAPSVPALRLRRDAHAELGARLKAAPIGAEVRDKIRLLHRGPSCVDPVPIARICFLEDDPAIALPRISRMSGSEQVAAVRRSLFRRQMAAILMQPQTLAAAAIALAQSVEVVRLTRPASGLAWRELGELVLGGSASR